MRSRKLALAAVLPFALAGCDLAALIEPDCRNPAPLLHASRQGDLYLVVFYDWIDARDETRRLERRYDFRAEAVFEHAVEGFAADLSWYQLKEIRCEDSVDFVEESEESRTGWWTTVPAL